MQHVEECRECSSFWNELQAAQKLILQLPRERVGAGFRDQLFERIRAGEGTPEAVFREPVPTWTKIRYALSGAAAAAAVLVAATWLHDDRASPTENHIAAPNQREPNQRELERRIPNAEFASQDGFPHFYENPLMSATQRLTTDVVALEAARQMEQRYDSVNRGLRRLERDATDANAVVEQVLDESGEFVAFGELLLDMRDRQRLVITPPEVDADLTVAVRLLGQAGQRQRSIDTVREVIAPALRGARLANLSRSISVTLVDPREERDVLVLLNTQRPEVFPKLFIVFGTAEDPRDLDVLRHGAFVLDDPCGASWVAPRSLVERRDGFLRMRAHTQVQQPK